MLLRGMLVHRETRFSLKDPHDLHYQENIVLQNLFAMHAPHIPHKSAWGDSSSPPIHQSITNLQKCGPVAVWHLRDIRFGILPLDATSLCTYGSVEKERLQCSKSMLRARAFLRLTASSICDRISFHGFLMQKVEIETVPCTSAKSPLDASSHF